MTDNVGLVTLQNANVNSGTAVVMNVTSVSYSWKNNVRADPVASSYALTEVEFRGWENPALTLSGTIDTNSITADNMITEILLKAFARRKGETLKLKIVYGETGAEQELSSATGALSGTGFPVQIDGFSLDLNVGEALNAHVIPYSMTLIEDK